MNKSIVILFLTLGISLLGCKKNNSNYTITIGAFSMLNGEYVSLGNELIFDSQNSCQTWSRTAQPDSHDTSVHLHYNAADQVSFDPTQNSFTWTEFGPELDQSSIESICLNGANGVMKTVNDTDYYQDKPNVYLKIISIIEH